MLIDLCELGGELANGDGEAGMRDGGGDGDARDRGGSRTGLAWLTPIEGRAASALLNCDVHKKEQQVSDTLDSQRHETYAVHGCVGAVRP